MHIDTTFPPPEARRRARFAKLIALCERDEIEAAVDALIGYLDAREGDADREDPDTAALTMCYPGEDFDFDDAPLIVADGLPGDPDDHEDSHDREAVDEREPQDYREPDVADPGTVKRHRNRIRRTRCRKITHQSSWGGSPWTEWRFHRPGEVGMGVASDLLG